MQIPPGYEKDTKIRKGLVIGGAITFGTLYIISAISGAALMSMAEDPFYTTTYSQEDAAMLLIPVAGPFVAQATLDPTAAGHVFLILDGVGQAGGLAMLIVGLAAKKEVLVRQDQASVTVAPMLGAGRTGLAATGTF